VIQLPYLIIGWGASIAAAGWVAFGLGVDHEIAKSKERDTLIAEVRKAAIEGAAHEIAKIKVQNTTIQQRAETVIREVPAYRECTHPSRVLDDINEALTGKPAGDSGVPRTVPAD
jgi:hypothetical protein